MPPVGPYPTPNPSIHGYSRQVTAIRPAPMLLSGRAAAQSACAGWRAARTDLRPTVLPVGGEMDKTPPAGRTTFWGEVLALGNGYRLAHAVHTLCRTLPQRMANEPVFGKQCGPTITLQR
jgi:hypothetical protein